MPTQRTLFPTALYAGVLSVCVGLPAARADTPPTVSAEAKAHFQRGTAAMRLGTPEGHAQAYREFKAAYEASPSWKILGNLGQAADELERDGEAIAALQEYLAQSRGQAGSRKSTNLQADLDRLQANVATVTLEAPGTLWIVDTRLPPDGEGEPVVNQYGPFEGGRAELRVRAGKHEFQLEGEAAASAAPWAVALEPGDTTSHNFAVSEPEPEPEPATAALPEDEPAEIEGPSHTASYVLWGLGAVGAGVSTILYLDAESVQSRADDAFAEHCPGGFDPADAACVDARADDARAANRRTAALVTGLGALGALVTGTVLYVLDSRPPAASGQADGMRLQPWIGFTSVGVSGTF